MTNEEIEIQMPKLKSRIKYDEDIFGTYKEYEEIILDLLENSKSICLETLFPYDDFSSYLLPKKYYKPFVYPSKLSSCLYIFVFHYHCLFPIVFLLWYLY